VPAHYLRSSHEARLVLLDLIPKNPADWVETEIIYALKSAELGEAAEPGWSSCQDRPTRSTEQRPYRRELNGPSWTTFELPKADFKPSRM
jgi:hypothetical protein